jgi:hypothetical protein
VYFDIGNSKQSCLSFYVSSFNVGCWTNSIIVGMFRGTYTLRMSANGHERNNTLPLLVGDKGGINRNERSTHAAPNIGNPMFGTTSIPRDVLSWTNQDPRESQLFNSWGVLYRFKVRCLSITMDHFHFHLDRRLLALMVLAPPRSFGHSAKTRKRMSQDSIGPRTEALDVHKLARFEDEYLTIKP